MHLKCYCSHYVMLITRSGSLWSFRYKVLLLVEAFNLRWVINLSRLLWKVLQVWWEKVLKTFHLETRDETEGNEF